MARLHLTLLPHIFALIFLSWGTHGEMGSMGVSQHQQGVLHAGSTKDVHDLIQHYDASGLAEYNTYLMREQQVIRRLENSTDSNTQDAKVEYTKDTKETDAVEVELPSCNDVLLHETPQDRCNHAKNCEGEYIMTTLLPLAFCTEPLDPHPILQKCFPIIFPLFLFVLTLLLFRLLGSTAENYFSPALEMISSEFQIPPALAGVTLLALGNGAPDVSAVVNAIKMSASEGIPLSLGELTGGGMFVQSVVVGRIVFLGSSMIAGKNSTGGKILGVKCREDLIRDITMYGISAGYVFWMCSRGVIFYRHVVAMLLLYCGYVAVVFVSEIRRYYTNTAIEDVTEELRQSEVKVSLLHTTTPSHDEEDPGLELSPRRHQDPSGNAVPNTRQQPDPPGIKQSTRVMRVMAKQQLRRQQRLLEKRKSLLGDERQPPQDRPMQMPMLQDRPLSIQLFIGSLRELFQHLYYSIYTEILSNRELSRFEWFCQSLESPFSIMRKLVTPIPCESDYNRSLVAYSIALSPFWLAFYSTTKVDDLDPFCTNSPADGTGFCFPSVFWPCCISFAIGCAVIKYGPTGEGATLPLRFSLPIALFGFVIAASWIDVISDQLVNLLEFIGVLLRIPAPIMGMTVLAWGNSVGDYTTNGALAQRGLADMSMAACFAGPSFNLLVGLGCGLLTQKESLLSDEGLTLTLVPSVQTGFIFLICNCVIAVISGIWNKGIIPKMHGYLFWSMYFAYMTMSAQRLDLGFNLR